jgi:Etoposide-induced protein 2.4 (EI24)
VNGLFDAFWRAAAYCLHPRVILLSLAPVLIAGGLVLGLGWLYWAAAVDAVQTLLSHWTLTDAALGWLDRFGGGGLRALVAPLVIVALALPMVVLLSLLLVALLMTPSIVSLVVKRRFPALEPRRGAAGWQTTLWSLAITALAALLLLASLPLWLVPPLALVLPPLIWGWASGKILAFEVLAEHADAAERRALLREHRGPLLAMGVVCGLMGAVPALVWAIGAFAIMLAPLLLIVSVWLYTLVFAFAAAWFAHYALAALQVHRATAPAPDVIVLESPPA